MSLVLIYFYADLQVAESPYNQFFDLLYQSCGFEDSDILLAQLQFLK